MEPKLTQKIAGSIKLFLLMPVLLLILACNGDEECRRIETYTDVVLAAFASPETFDEYVENNQDLLGSDFNQCLEKNIAELRREYERETDTCDEVFDQGSDFWHSCYGEAEQSFLAPIFYLEDIQLAAQQDQSFLMTPSGGAIYFLKASDPSFYNEFILVLRDVVEETGGACELCKKKKSFLGMF